MRRSTVLACLLLASCGTRATQTETIVIVNAQPMVRAAASQLHVLVHPLTAGGGADFERTTAAKWPTKLALAPAHADAARSYSVVAEALAADQSVIASARLLSGYVKAQERFVTLMIEDACIGVVCSDPQTTCHEKGCVSAHLLPIDLGPSAELAPISVDFAKDAGATDAMVQANDAGTDAGALSSSSDAGTKDAGAHKDVSARCQRDAECGLQHCVDGYCCEADCTDACKGCNVPGSEGHCVAVPFGTAPASGHPDCGPDGASSCQRDGMCDGKGACRLYPSGTECGASSCDGKTNTFTASSSCDGEGNCVAGSTLSCAPYLCADAMACFASCSAAGAQCSSGNVCSNGSCGLKGIGASCSADAECDSTHCVDKVCCNVACTETCKSCNQGPSLGHCTVNPPGTDPRSECSAASGADAFCTPGKCDGAGACNLANPGTVCQAATCTTGYATAAATCNAMGRCTLPSPTGCGPYVCNAQATACANPCQQQADCLPGFYCNAGSCLSCVPTSASNPVYVDPTNGVDDASHGAQPAQCAYKTITYALAHATGTINLLNTGSYTGATETYPITLTGSQILNCDPTNTHTKAQLVLPSNGTTTTVQMNGAGTKLLNCDVSAASNVGSFSSCVTIGVAGAVTIDGCSLHNCAPSTAVGVSGGNLNGATITNSVISNVANCFNQMGNVTIGNIQCGAGNDWINGCGTLTGSGNCCSIAGSTCGPPCNACSCPGGFFTTPLTCP